MESAKPTIGNFPDELVVECRSLCARVGGAPVALHAKKFLNVSMEEVDTQKLSYRESEIVNLFYN